MIKEDNNLRILICIGGGPEALNGLRFAAQQSRKACASIALLYVRPLDSGLKSGGMEVRVARENLLDWGLELPGRAHLNKARNILVELGEISEEAGNDWYHVELSGDTAGEYIRDYANPCGGTISMRLRTASDVTSAIADEAERFNADFIIVGGSPDPVEGFRKLVSPKSLALKIASHCDRSIIIARRLEPDQGHLVCVQDNELSRSMLPKVLRFGQACDFPITLLSVAEDQGSLESATRAVNHAARFFRDNDIEPQGLLVEKGDPAKIITEIGREYSRVILAA